MTEKSSIPLNITNNKCMNAIHDKVLQKLRDEERKLDDTLESLSQLDNETLEYTRKKRIQELKNKQQNLFKYKQLNHGKLTEVHDEKEFFQAVKESDRLAVHFFRPTTWRCEVVDKKMIILASRYISTRFIKLNVENSPFLVERFKIWCIPTIMLIKNGVTSHSIIGFDELGGDNFSEKTFEKILREHDIITEEEND